MKSNTYKIILSLLYFIIIGYRFFSLFPPAPSIDIGAFAVQGLHVLEGKYPLFYYGQNFMGTGGVYIIALFYKLFGISYFSLYLVGLTFTSLTILFTLALAYFLFGEICAIMTAVFFLVPTSMMMEFSHIPNPDYALTFVLAPLILLLTYIIITKYREKKCIFNLSLTLGLLSGFGMWNNLLIGPCVVLSFLFIAVSLKKDFFNKNFLIYTTLFCIGFMPEIIANIKMNFFIFKSANFDNIRLLPEKILNFFNNGFPFFWGWQDVPYKSFSLFRSILLIWILFLFASFYYMAFFTIKDKKQKLAFFITGGYLFFHLTISIITFFGRRYGHTEFPTPYIQVLFGISYVMASAAIINFKISNFKKFILFLPVLIFLANNFTTNLPQVKSCIAYLKANGIKAIEPKLKDSNDPLIKLCTENNIDSGYVDGMIVPELRFDYLNKYNMSNSYEEAYLPNSIAADKSKNIFWGGHYPANLDKIFDSLNLEYRILNIPGHMGKTFYNITEKNIFSSALINDFDVKTSLDSINAGFVKDRNILSLMSTARTQMKDDYLLIELKETKKLSRLTLIPENHSTLPLYFSILTSLDGNEWTKIQTFENHGRPIFFSVYHPFIKIVKPRAEFFLGNIDAKFIKIQINKESDYPLSLREIYLYEYISTGDKKSYENDLSQIIATIKNIGRNSLIIGDHWFESYFYSENFKVEFIPNRSIDNYGTESIFIYETPPVDFSKSDSIIIAAKAHSLSISNSLTNAGLKFEMKTFQYYDLFVCQKSNTSQFLYWNGLEFLNADKNNIQYPDIKELFKPVSCSVDFGNKFKMVNYAFNLNNQFLTCAFEVNVLENIKDKYFMFIHFTNDNDKIIFQGDFMMSSFSGTTENWKQSNRVLLEKNIEIPDNINLNELNVKIGIWDPLKKKNLKINYSKESRYTIGKYKDFL